MIIINSGELISLVLMKKRTGSRIKEDENKGTEAVRVHGSLISTAASRPQGDAVGTCGPFVGQLYPYFTPSFLGGRLVQHHRISQRLLGFDVL